MLIIIEVVNKQNLKTMKNLFYSLVVVLGLASCTGGSDSTSPSTDSTAVDSTQVDSCRVDSCKVDSCKKMGK
jgi:hypothetical protein